VRFCRPGAGVGWTTAATMSIAAVAMIVIDLL